jgi:hypothetical protein
MAADKQHTSPSQLKVVSGMGYHKEANLAQFDVTLAGEITIDLLLSGLREELPI